MEILTSQARHQPWQECLSQIAELNPLHPFAETSIEFVDAVSKSLLSDHSSREWPELPVVAHWIRKAHILKLRENSTDSREIRLGRGLAVHFAPSNVDTIFLYSWLLSLLAGNSNIIRVSQKKGKQLLYIIDKVNEVLDRPEYEVLKIRNMIVSYKHDDALNHDICSYCSIRVLWGGDETVTALRKIPLPPLATELAFADRFSIAALSARSVLDSNEVLFAKLVRQFFNDSFAFDQLACSSPRLIVWTGTAVEIDAAKERFWSELRRLICQKQISYPSVVTMNRMTAVYAYAATGQAKTIRSKVAFTLPTRVQLKQDAKRFRALHCGRGLFLELDLATLCDLAEVVTSKDQTLSYFGYHPMDLERLAASLPKRSIDRIVPIGRALEFSSTWDGVDLIRAFTRCIEIW